MKTIRLDEMSFKGLPDLAAASHDLRRRGRDPLHLGDLGPTEGRHPHRPEPQRQHRPGRRVDPLQADRLDARRAAPVPHLRPDRADAAAPRAGRQGHLHREIHAQAHPRPRTGAWPDDLHRDSVHVQRASTGEVRVARGLRQRPSRGGRRRTAARRGERRLPRGVRDPDLRGLRPDRDRPGDERLPPRGVPAHPRAWPSPASRSGSWARTARCSAPERTARSGSRDERDARVLQAT